MATVRIEERVNDARMAAIAGDASLVELEICDGRDLSAKGLSAIAGARGLRKLSLSRVNKAVGKGIDALAELALEEIRLTHCSKLDAKSLAPLATMRSLRVVDLSFCSGIADGAVEALAGLVALEELALHACVSITDRALEHIGGAVGLRRLDVGACEIHTLGTERITAAGVKHLAGLRALESLDVGNNRAVGDPATKYIAELQELCELRLTHGVETSSEGLLALASLERLEKLDLFSSRHVTDAVVEGLAHLPLKELNLGDCGRWEDGPLGDDGMRSLRRMRQLESLDLRMCASLTDQGLAHLGSLPELRKLDVVGADAVTERGIAMLPALEELALGFTGAMSGAGLQAALRGMPALRNLRIVARRPDVLTDEALAAIVADLPQLRALSLWYADRITAAGLGDLRGLPALETIEIYSCGKLRQADADRLLGAAR
jgi:hypothetical protein